MPELFQIRILPGAQARPVVDPLYEKNGRQACARNEDLFFVAIDGSNTLGCVRYCVENDTPILRTMMIDAGSRRRGIGSQLLREFTGYMDSHSIGGVYCLPYAHLDRFYGSAGFQRISIEDAPLFLQERLHAYDPSGPAYLVMKRP
jgi:N-acetylglutamate synthase-like GNAT family acetyltransferase